MSGLNSYLARNSTPPLGQGNRSDREAAQNLKIKPGRLTNHTGYANQKDATAARAAGYASTENHDVRKTNYAPNYSQQDEKADVGLDDSIISSDFDVTRSDITLEQRGVHNGQEVESYPAHDEHLRQYENDQQFGQSHQPRFKQGQTPIIPHYEQARKQAVASGISGRFQQQENYQYPSDFPLRPIQIEHLQISTSRKRGHPTEPIYKSSNEVAYREDDDYEERSSEDESGEEEMDLPGQEGFLNSDSPVRPDIDPRKLHSDTAESNAPAAGQHRLLKSQVLSSAKFSPDYSEKELKEMNYSDLNAESWETTPNALKFVLPENLQGPSVTLEARIDYYAEKAYDKDKGGREEEEVDGFEEQVKFYTNLSTSEWDQAGDYLVSKFSEILQQLKKAKQDKRKMMEGFEAEVGAREKAVRGKSEKFDAEFDAMKSNGEDLLRGKMSNSPAL